MRWGLLAACMGVSVIVGCRREPQASQRAGRAPEASQPGGGARVPTGSPVVSKRRFGVAIYTPAAPSPARMNEARELVRTSFPGLKLRATMEELTPPSAAVLAPDIATLPPPDAKTVALFGRGLDAERAKEVANSKGVLALLWNLDVDAKSEKLRKAEALAGDLAAKSGGVLWDAETREIFSVSAWKERRVDGWEGDVPDVSRHFVIHYYADEDRHRMVTLGLVKLGVPDVAVSDVPRHQASEMQTLVLAIAQLLVEGAAVGGDGRLEVNLAAIRHSRARSDLLATSPSGAHRTSVTLTIGKQEEGDADNRLVELRFDGHPGATEAERQAAAVKALSGASEDQTTRARASDPELEAAAARVRARLPAVAAAFKKGLPVGERISVKAPFNTDNGGVEWMWIEVTAWDKGRIQGSLSNEPEWIARLSLGAKVEVAQDAVADYLWRKADGTHEGGESVEVLKRRASE
jgi:uncharacterized protein YegJ (DUF2314 family)